MEGWFEIKEEIKININKLNLVLEVKDQIKKNKITKESKILWPTRHKTIRPIPWGSAAFKPIDPRLSLIIFLTKY